MSKTTALAFEGDASIRALADALKKDVTIENDKAVVPKDRYEAILPDGLDMKTIKKVQDFHGKLPAALTLAAGELAVPYFKKHKDVDTVKVRLPVGRDAVETVVRREADIRNVATGETSQVFGQTQTKWRINGANGSSGQLRVVRDFVQNMAASALKV